MRPLTSTNPASGLLLEELAGCEQKPTAPASFGDAYEGRTTRLSVPDMRVIPV